MECSLVGLQPQLQAQSVQQVIWKINLSQTNNIRHLSRSKEIFLAEFAKPQQTVEYVQVHSQAQNKK